MTMEYHFNMPDEVNLKPNASSQLSLHASNELEKLVREYRQKIIEEAERLDAAERREDDPPEITRQHIKKAALITELRINKYHPSKVALALEGVAFTCTFLAGLFTNHIHEIWGSIGLIAVFCLGFTAFLLTKVKND